MGRSEAFEIRLRALGIDANTKHNIALLRPDLSKHIGDVVEGFYSHILQFPEVAALLAKAPSGGLKQRQAAHWLEMFECRFDDHYLAGALRIGRVHFDRKVPPRLYLAGHNYFHCRIIELAAQKYGQSRELPVALASIARIIALDIDLALSSYTHAFWTKAPADADSVWL